MVPFALTIVLDTLAHDHLSLVNVCTSTVVETSSDSLKCFATDDYVTIQNLPEKSFFLYTHTHTHTDTQLNYRIE